MQPGDFYLADIPFTGGTASTRRPALILWVGGLDVVAAVVTSASPRSVTDVPVRDWRTAGLRLPSTVRLLRIDTLARTLLLRRLGHLSMSDATAVRAAWTAHVRLNL